MRDILSWLSDNSGREKASAAALQMLIDDEIEAYREHEAEHQAWKAAYDDSIPPPTVRATKFDTFRKKLASVLPNLSLRLVDRTRVITTSGARPDDFSAGERQVFALVLLAEIAPRIDFFLVDEPELNLHPGLANRLWSIVEAAFPSSVFIYATHSYDFATRPSMESILLLRARGVVQCSLDDFRAHATETRSLLLSSVSSAEKSSTLLFCEGTQNSLDAQLLECLFIGNHTIKISPVGPSSAVIQAAAPGHSWRNVLVDLRVAGLVDRDYRTDREIEGLESAGVMVHELHEIESYLAHPDVVRYFLRAYGKPELDNAELLEIYRTPFVEEVSIVRESMRRWSAGNSLSLRPSVPTRAALASVEAAAAAVMEQIADFYRSATEEDVRASMQQVTDKIRADLATTDPEHFLRVFPGKPVFAEVGKLWDGRGHEAFSSLLAVLRAAPTSHYPAPLVRLRDRVLAVLRPPADTEPIASTSAQGP